MYNFVGCVIVSLLTLCCAMPWNNTTGSTLLLYYMQKVYDRQMN